MRGRLAFAPRGPREVAAAGGYDIRPLQNFCQQRSAGQLVQRMYAWRGYRAEASHPLPQADTSRLVLAAWRDEEVAGTLTVGVDSPRGLLSETLYRREVGSLRRPGRLISEISRLAVDPGHSARELLAALFRAAYHHVSGTFRATDLVIEVNPRHARYYQRQFGFRQAGELRHCPRVEAPAILLHRELDRGPGLNHFSCAGGAF